MAVFGKQEEKKFKFLSIICTMTYKVDQDG
jgi:hypothetical protein